MCTLGGCKDATFSPPPHTHHATTHLDHHLGVQPVEGRVCAVCECAHWVCEDALLANELLNLLAESCVAPIIKPDETASTALEAAALTTC
jgi:hypothetical protein